jgi:hypothetical protein
MSIQKLGQQCLEAWQLTRGAKIPTNYKNVKNIVVAGMGADRLC